MKEDVDSGSIQENMSTNKLSLIRKMYIWCRQNMFNWWNPRLGFSQKMGPLKLKVFKRVVDRNIKQFKIDLAKLNMK